MRTPVSLVLATVASLIAADLAAAQPGYPPPPPPGGHVGRPPPAPYQANPQRYYYNGRWVGPDEWGRRSYERERWARNYERRHRDRDRDHDDSSALIAGIVGFALGAAIVGSMEQADHARTAGGDWDSYCARKYRSYDRRSRTYLGGDGLRHYCQ